MQFIQVRYHDLLRCSFCMQLGRVDLVALQHVLHQRTTSIDHKLAVTHAYRKAIRSLCRQFVILCRNLNLFSQSIIVIDGSKFKAVNNRDRNFTQGKVKARMQQIEQSIYR